MANADCTVERVARALQYRDFEGDTVTADETWDACGDGDEYQRSYRADAMRILAALQPAERWYADYRREVEAAR